MAGKRYQNIFLTIKCILVFQFSISCSSSSETDKILTDISSNSYYVCLTAKYGDESHEIVIPNNRLYSILQSEQNEVFDLDSYVDQLSPVITGKKKLELTKASFMKIKPYVIPTNWADESFEVSKYFTNGVQHSEIEDELILIKQLYHKGYLVYKDDETGWLVLNHN